METTTSRGPGARAGPAGGLSASVLDALPFALVGLTADGRVRGANRPFLDLVGMRDAAALPSDLRELFPEPRHLEWWLEKALSHGEITTKALLRLPGGRRIDAWLTLRNVPGEDGLVAVVRTLRAGARRPLEPRGDEEVEQALHLTGEWSRAIVAAADQVGLGLAISASGDDGEPLLAFVNAAGARILGKTKEELVHGPAFPRFTPESEARLRLGGPASLDKLVVEHELPDGSLVRLQLGFSHGDYWGRPAVFTFFRDVTREQELEEAERSAREQLLHSLEETARLKTELLNVAAHELSNPLTPIALQVEMLKGALAQGASGKERSGLEMLDRNVKRLSRLLGDLLEVSRMQAGRLALKREPVELTRVAREVLESYADTAARLGVELVQEVPAEVRLDADPDRLAQVVGNLVSNALRFTPRGGRVVVNASVGAEGVVVRVTDTGTGMRAEDIPRLFQPFGQLQGKEKGGTGLGLFISKGIVEQHGGRIWAESEGLGKGSTFSFSIPFRPAAVSNPRTA